MEEREMDLLNSLDQQQQKKHLPYQMLMLLYFIQEEMQEHLQL